MRPIVIGDDSQEGWAVNAQHDTVVKFDASLSAVSTFRTLRGPVSIALYDASVGTDREQLLVVCSLSNALVRHRRSDGEILEVIPLPPEPGDLLVDVAGDRAWVSSGGVDRVAEIDLLNTSGGPIREYVVPARNPAFLTMTEAGDVLVAPRWSGNNSAVHRMPESLFPNGEFNPMANNLSVLDLADPAVAVPPGLPDEDLFWLDPTNEKAVVVARGVGTILLANGQNPSTKEFWQLNTDANNKDAALQDEPAIRGFISSNRVTRFQLPSPIDSAVVDPSQQKYIDLDQINPTGGYDRDTAVGSPYSLVFSDAGFALVAGLLTDNLTLLGSGAEWITEWDLPDGCVPRQVVLDPTEQFILVYCSGTNTIPVYFTGHIFLDGGPPVIGTVDLGFDPTPESIREGRKIFFDASNSLNNNHSCATCHDEGELDLLAWNLSDGQRDDKGPMVTQSLASINKLVPFHWRGEQQGHLLDFNAAFDGLLGGSELETGPGSDFEKFEDWVLSLEVPANPFANRERVVDDTIAPPILSPGQTETPNAISGQGEFFDPLVGNCFGCHASPAGTSNSMVGDGAVFRDAKERRHWFKTAPFTHLPMRGLQPDVSVNVFGSQQTYPRVGVGTAHAGNPRNIFHFSRFFPGIEPSDMAAFLFQFDSGLGGAVHAQVLMTPNNVAAAESELNHFLLPQAEARNADVGVFGTVSISGTERTYGWVYERDDVGNAGVFRRDDGVANRLSFFTQESSSSGATFAFVGMPVGTGRGWAIDFDQDDLLNAFEGLTPTGEDGRYVVDTDGDGDWDGYEWENGGDPFDPSVGADPSMDQDPAILSAPPEFQWTTTRVGRLTFETDELTTAHLTLVPNASTPTLEVSSDLFKRQHGMIVDRFSPGVTYLATLTITDVGGRDEMYDFSVTSTNFVDGPDVVILGDLHWTTTDPVPGVPGRYHFVADARVDFKIHLPPGLPAGGQVVIARALVNGVPVTNLDLTTQDTGFCVLSVPYLDPPIINATPGPFIVSGESDPNGLTQLDFELDGLVPGDEVDLVIEAIDDYLDTACSIGPNLGVPSQTNPVIIPVGWSFPDTPKEFRALEFVVN